MPTPPPDPDELRRALRADASNAEGARLDLDEVLARSRRERRRRRTTLVGGTAAAVAVLAIGGIALTGGLGLNAGSTTADAPASSSADTDAETEGQSLPSTGVAPADEPPEEELVLRPVDRLNACGAPPVGATAPGADGLTISIASVGRLDAGGSAQATVVLTNTGETRYRGELFAGPALTIADEVTRWHTSGLEAVRTPLELAPGASVELAATLRAVRCDDDASLADPGALPALAPGEYRLSAAVALAAPGAALGVPLVSEAVELTVR